MFVSSLMISAFHFDSLLNSQNYLFVCMIVISLWKFSVCPSTFCSCFFFYDPFLVWIEVFFLVLLLISSTDFLFLFLFFLFGCKKLYCFHLAQSMGVGSSMVKRMPSGFRDWLRQKPDMGEAEGPLKDLWVLKAPNYA